MPDKEELKPKTLRVSDETMNNFRRIASEIGSNQDVALSKLLEVYQMQQEKAALPKMQKQIEEFEGHVSYLTQAYIGLLKSLSSQEEVVKTRFKQQIDTANAKIKELQEDLQTAKRENADVKKDLSAARKESFSLQDKIKELEKQHTNDGTSIHALLSVNESFKEQSENLKRNLDEVTEKCDNLDKNFDAERQKLKDKITGQASDNQRLMQTVSDLRKQLEAEQEKAEKGKFTYEKNLLEERNHFQSELRKTDQEYQKSIENLRYQFEEKEKQYLHRIEDLTDKLTEKGSSEDQK